MLKALCSQSWHRHERFTDFKDRFQEACQNRDLNPFAGFCLPACRAGKDALGALYLQGWQAHERVSDSMRDSDGILEVFAMHLAHLLHAASQCGSHFLPCIWMPVLATESASRSDCAASSSGCPTFPSSIFACEWLTQSVNHLRTPILRAGGHVGRGRRGEAGDARGGLAERRLRANP